MADDAKPDLVRRWEGLEAGHQAAIAFEIHTGVPAPLDAMRAALPA